MSEEGVTVESRSWPTNLGEFVQIEANNAREALGIHKENLSLIEKGDEDVKEIYGGVDGARELADFSRGRLKRFEEARDTFQQGDKKLALELLEEQIMELNRLASHNLWLGNQDFAKGLIAEINLIREFREK